MNSIKFVIIYFLTSIHLSLFAGQTFFLLLSGPSGIGKSTLIKELQKMDPRFIYIQPYTTRALRKGETDKIHKSLEEIQELNAQNQLAALNYIYGNYYATPLGPIQKALDENLFPILDWPVTKIELMKSLFRNHVISIYLTVNDECTLLDRLRLDSRDISGERFLAGKTELEAFKRGEFDHLIDATILNDEKEPKEIALSIYSKYLEMQTTHL